MTIDWKLLKQVSRSFYLSLRWAPGSVRETLALGYLLARATDTLADESKMAPADRIGYLQATIQRDHEALRRLELPDGLSSEAERRLVQKLPVLISQWEHSPDRNELDEVLGWIVHGQIFDLTRFPPGNVESLSPEELHSYTYWVAGSVGEFWTKIWMKYLPPKNLPNLAPLLALARDYGCGLQLINILRDREKDEKLDRRYLRAEDVPVLAARARLGMAAGLSYCEGISHPGMRYCSILPALLGLATLDIMQRDPVHPAKLRRWQVYGILLSALPVLFLPRLNRGSRE